jgi:hypothetical protein
MAPERPTEESTVKKAKTKLSTQIAARPPSGEPPVEIRIRLRGRALWFLSPFVALALVASVLSRLLASR